MCIEEKYKLLEKRKNSKKYLEENIALKHQKYFKIEGKRIIRNEEEIENSIFKSGSIVFIVQGKKLKREEILETYRNRDKIEKEINVLKNQIDSKRLRAHNKDTTNGRLFIKFIALIQHASIKNIVKKDEKLSKYSISEIMSELKKLKINLFDKENIFLTELTKKTKTYF